MWHQENQYVLLKQLENGTHTPRNWDSCDSRKLVNFLFMITKSLLWDFIDIRRYSIIACWQSDVLIYDRDWWQREVPFHSFHEAFIILLWFGFNFDLSSLLPLCLPLGCGIFMGVGREWKGKTKGKDRGIPIIPSFRFTEHFAIMSDLSAEHFD